MKTKFYHVFLGKFLGTLYSNFFQENFRIEFFKGGTQSLALNLYNSSDGRTNLKNITVEKYGKLGAFGWDTPTLFRLVETVERDGMEEFRLYKDLSFFNAPENYIKLKTEGDKGILLEEKAFAKNGKYFESLLYNDGGKMNTLYYNLTNTGLRSDFQVGATSQYWLRGGGKTTAEDHNIHVGINPPGFGDDERGSELELGVKYNNRRLFSGNLASGWIELLQEHLNEMVSKILKERLEAKDNIF